VSGLGENGPELEVDAENWVQELVPGLSSDDVARLGPDRDILFEALVEFVQKERPQGVEVERVTEREAVAADAALLLPGAWIHIRATPELKPTIKDIVSVVVVYVLRGGDPLAGGIALTIDLAYRFFEKATKLDQDELRIVMTLLDLGRGGEGSGTEKLQQALPDLEGVEERLEELAEKKVVRGDSGGWIVNF
jgi:hypothetical protein